MLLQLISYHKCSIITTHEGLRYVNETWLPSVEIRKPEMHSNVRLLDTNTWKRKNKP